MKTLCVFQAFAHSVHEDLAQRRVAAHHSVRRDTARATARRRVGLEYYVAPLY
ncbi:hypothetical protein [Natrinema soli]|uniref:hypothetical protein n=1 Tax=Natrinema soli TaxID=1930624 RepID=UPI00235F2735|nr:hypothetical protein [Natrinema soli]